MSVIIVTTGVPGSGKTYVRCARFLVDHFLKETNAHYFTNFPVNIDAICKKVCKPQKKRGKLYQLFFGRYQIDLSEEAIRNRIHVFSDLLISNWRKGIGGPWSYFSKLEHEGFDLKGAHVAIDEIQELIGTNTPSDLVAKWDEFLGTVRHRGLTFEAITQDFDQVHQCLTGRASLVYNLLPMEDQRDPFFHIPLIDWYNLKAKFTGSFHKTVLLEERQKQGGKGGNWKKIHSHVFLIQPEYFQFYNSFNASALEKESGYSQSKDRVPQYEFQKRNIVSLLFWFLRKNFTSIFSRVFLLILVYFLTFGGGISWLMKGLFSTFQGISNRNGKQAVSLPVSRSDDVPASNAPADNLPTVNPVSAQKAPESVLFHDFGRVELFSDYIPCFFSSNESILRNGMRIITDYKFESGSIFHGYRVKEVNSADRYYVVSDGVNDVYLRMRFIRQQVEEQKQSLSSSVSASRTPEAGATERRKR